MGRQRELLGTNPMAVAVPALEEPPIVLDMAPTVAAYGKVRLKAQRGEAMPVGWMIDREGKPLTDPKRADEGYLLPIGDYKGYGLSLIIALLAGALNRAALGARSSISSKKPARQPIPARRSWRWRSRRSCRPRSSKRPWMVSSATFASRAGCRASSASGFPVTKAMPNVSTAARTEFRCRKRCA